MLNTNHRLYRTLSHSHHAGACPLCTSIFQSFTLSPRFLHVVVDLSLWTGVRPLSIYDHWSDPRPLHSCCFLLVRVISLSVQVITQTPSAYSHRSDPRLLYPHGYRIICPPCSHSHWSGPRPLRGGYTPLLNCFIPHVCGALSLMSFGGFDMCLVARGWT